jgi:transposase
MARWRQAVELAMTDEDIEKLAAIARSRSEAARRAERAQILLAYREKPSFFAVGQRPGLHHQTVQRCVERALACGPLTALDDRPGPRKEPTIYTRGKSVVGISGLRQGQGSRLSARIVDDAVAGTACARERVSRRARISRQTGAGNGVQDTRQRGNQAAQGTVRRDAELEQKMAEVLCVYREV